MTFDRAAEAFDNPDYVDIVTHNYRHRLGLAPGYPDYEASEKKLALIPPISVPTITLDGMADGVIPATDGQSSAAKFSGPRTPIGRFLTSATTCLKRHPRRSPMPSQNSCATVNGGPDPVLSVVFAGKPATE